MLKFNFSLRKFIEIFLTLLLLVLMSKRMGTQLYILSGFNILFRHRNIYIITIVSFVFYLLLNGYSKIQSRRFLPSFLTLFFLCVVSVIVFPSNSGSLSEITLMIFSYLPVFILSIGTGLGQKFRYKEHVLQTIIIFCFLQACLGIYQAIFTKTVVPIEFEGNNIVSSIFYLNGASSSYSYYLNLGARIRAFGMTDSGLTLSLFSLWGITLLDKIKSAKLKIFLTSVFILAIYLSLTRLTWILTILYFIILFIKNRVSAKLFSNIISFIFYTGLIVQFSIILFVIMENYISNFGVWTTLTSRLEGFKYYLSALEFNVLTVLFGQNFLNRLAEFQVYTLDNELFVHFANLGTIGVILFCSVYNKAIKVLRSKATATLILLSLFYFAGIGNSVTYFFAPVAFFMLGLESE